VTDNELWGGGIGEELLSLQRAENERRALIIDARARLASPAVLLPRRRWWSRLRAWIRRLLGSVGCLVTLPILR
jgi:hypothetical protein